MNDNHHYAIVRRLAIANGHIKAIERMIQETDTSCIDIVQQIQAVQSSLNKVTSSILEAYLHNCLTIVADDDSVAERERMLKEVASIFQFSSRR